MEDLKPCPFCGSLDLDVFHNNDSDYVHCNQCFTDGPGAMDPVAAWNTRADVTHVPHRGKVKAGRDDAGML